MEASLSIQVGLDPLQLLDVGLERGKAHPEEVADKRLHVDFHFQEGHRQLFRRDLRHHMLDDFDSGRPRDFLLDEIGLSAHHSRRRLARFVHHFAEVAIVPECGPILTKNRVSFRLLLLLEDAKE
uniref:Uncharacterized protein n=1 Tax=Favella ehrenbergii TaxID=182087 RepID=A0A7S3HU46_9SPIT|mmetsp:Transcript_2408/g.3325  ORF Transcript_2408/g.3325 Transcript_2408/m.3325 type:complete len:125 (-) Transcript_2408:41-415(-)